MYTETSTYYCYWDNFDMNCVPHRTTHFTKASLLLRAAVVLYNLKHKERLVEVRLERI